MSVFTISPCLFTCEIKQWAPIIASFVSNKELKIALDEKGRAMDKYKNYPIDINRSLIISCLDLILKCAKYEQVKISDCDDCDLFLEICANTVGARQIVVATKQTYPHLDFIDNNTIRRNGKTISMFDKDEAFTKISQTQNVNIGCVNNSVFTATGNIH